MARGTFKKYDSNRSAAIDYARIHDYFLRRLTSIAISCFSWDGLPDEIRQRFLETQTLYEGHTIFYFDEVMGEYMNLRCLLNGPFNRYDEPVRRRAFEQGTGYHYNCTDQDSVIIYDSYLHDNLYPYLQMFAKHLTELEITMKLNIRAQRRPVVLLCDERERLSMENLFMKIDMGAPAIFGKKGLDLENIKALELKSPYVVDKLHEEKMNILREAFSFLGIGSLDIEKKERLVTREVQVSQEANVSQRSSRLKARQEAAEQINRMFGLDVTVAYNPEGLHMAKEFYEAMDEQEVEVGA